jgi:predicted dehydrogenase
MIKVAVVGCGAWGKNLVRVFHELPDVNLVYCCDSDKATCKTMADIYPCTSVTSRFEDILLLDSIQAVVISTPSPTHYALAKAALEAGKHVFVEKPLALRADHAEELVALAEAANLKLMVGHLLLYHPVIVHLKRIINLGEWGETYYISSQRLNLGTIRQDENALWSLAPHDISVALHLLGGMPESVSARGGAYLQEGVEDVVSVNIKWPDGRMAQIQVSWLAPEKVRKLTVVGSEQMTVFDDTKSGGKLTIIHKDGDVYIPNLDMTEPLRAECQHFVDCIAEDKQPLTDGADGANVVKVLEAAQLSLGCDGMPTTVEAWERRPSPMAIQGKPFTYDRIKIIDSDTGEAQ